MTNHLGEPDYELAMQLADECLAELGIHLPPMSPAEFRAAFEDLWGPGFPLLIALVRSSIRVDEGSVIR